MTEPIARPDSGDIAQKAQSVDDGIDESGAVPTAPSVKNRGTSDRDCDDLPLAKASMPSETFWPLHTFASLTKQRSFIDDLASANQPHRPRR